VKVKIFQISHSSSYLNRKRAETVIYGVTAMGLQPGLETGAKSVEASGLALTSRPLMMKL